MPSGSLCAERNAFGTAVSMYPFLRREDFVAVAVLSLTSGAGNLNPLPPCGVCSEWIEKVCPTSSALLRRSSSSPRATPDVLLRSASTVIVAARDDDGTGGAKTHRRHPLAASPKKSPLRAAYEGGEERGDAGGSRASST